VTKDHFANAGVDQHPWYASASRFFMEAVSASTLALFSFDQFGIFTQFFFFFSVILPRALTVRQDVGSSRTIGLVFAVLRARQTSLYYDFTRVPPSSPLGTLFSSFFFYEGRQKDFCFLLSSRGVFNDLDAFFQRDPLILRGHGFVRPEIFSDLLPPPPLC